MSNKTQLQTNNAKLTSLISELLGKAAGGGSAEMCTVTISTYLSVYGSGWVEFFMYNDGTMYRVEIPNDNIERTLSVPKGSAICLACVSSGGLFSVDIQGEIENRTMAGDWHVVLEINGNGAVIIEDGGSGGGGGIGGL